MQLPIPSIESTGNEGLAAAIRARLDSLTKPPRSLGRLEELAEQYCLCRGRADARLIHKSLYIFAGDHGIVEEGVAPYPREVTPQMVLNMLAGGAAISVLCKAASINRTVVDMGVDCDFEDIPGLVKSKVARGTKSFLRGPAMTAEECGMALTRGYELGSAVGSDIAGVGEMGIGNTSSASALTALLLGCDPRETVGRGTGADDSLLARKREVVASAVEFHRGTWDGTPFDALRRVGGLEIAGIAGFILGAASVRVPVVVDGFIATSAALSSMRLVPAVEEYLIFAHVASEQFHRSLLQSLGVKPLLDLGMRLGEGTGAALGIQIVEQAMNCYHGMATFESAGVAGRNA
jgi:nicotinate-nucleotide--dimethylbenzimidazole phosphoribosyltransferase